jgi:hypothetical protein
MNILKIGLSVTLFLFSTLIKAQEPKIEEKKIQEVVFIDAEPKAIVANADGSFPPGDTGKAGPMNSAEILKRAVNYVEIETPKYIKGNGVSTSSKAECLATFVYKAKELNPQADANGVFTMHISIDAKEGKYRYTISKINHVAKNPEFSGGDVYSEFPKCGSMKIPPELWKKLCSQALKHAAFLVSDLKEAMKIPSNKNLKGEEW